MGFASDALSGEYLAGKRFFEFLTFVGCAPKLLLTPAEGEGYLRITIPELDAPRLLAAPKPRPVCCPQCQSRVADWLDHVSTEQTPQLRCPQCSKTSSLESLDFHRRACFAQTIIQISPVFEGEASPSDAFLAALEGAFHTVFKSAFV